MNRFCDLDVGVNHPNPSKSPSSRKSRIGKFRCCLKGVEMTVETTPCFNMVKQNSNSTN
ncbi:MAG: hypothetical protein ACTSX0_13325 [Promethearchaeota archaeon]